MINFKWVFDNNEVNLNVKIEEIMCLMKAIPHFNFTFKGTQLWWVKLWFQQVQQLKTIDTCRFKIG